MLKRTLLNCRSCLSAESKVGESLSAAVGEVQFIADGWSGQCIAASNQHRRNVQRATEFGVGDTSPFLILNCSSDSEDYLWHLSFSIHVWPAFFSS